ncbi:MAG TPA: hypothetical protein VH186_24275 [Chloroflexia bacterium]|nr:hypothetical protein [Chloroflexia bacterium]
MEQELAQFARMARVLGGSIRLVAYLGVLATIAFAVVGFFYVEPFRSGRITGSYWSLIVYDEVLMRWLGPISGLSFLVLIGFPVLYYFTGSNVRKPQPLPKPLKLLNLLLLLLTIVSWVMIGISSFRQSGYRHEDNAITQGQSFFLASKPVGNSKDSATEYFVYRCDQFALNCNRIYSEIVTGYRFVPGRNPREVIISLDGDTNRLKLDLRRHDKVIYVPL